jgi:hypothetical protein
MVLEAGKSKIKGLYLERNLVLHHNMEEDISWMKEREGGQACLFIMILNLCLC